MTLGPTPPRPTIGARRQTEVRTEDELRQEAERQLLVVKGGYAPRQAEAVLQAREAAETRAEVEASMKAGREAHVSEMMRLADAERRLRSRLAQLAELQALEDARVQAARIAGRPVGPQLNVPDWPIMSID